MTFWQCCSEAFPRPNVSSSCSLTSILRTTPPSSGPGLYNWQTLRARLSGSQCSLSTVGCAQRVAPQRAAVKSNHRHKIWLFGSAAEDFRICFPLHCQKQQKPDLLAPSSIPAPRGWGCLGSKVLCFFTPWTYISQGCHCLRFLISCPWTLFCHCGFFGMMNLSSRSLPQDLQVIQTP